MFFQKVFNRYSFIFSGKTKKVSYEGGLDGVKVFPIQAITAVVYTATGLISTLLFLHSYYALAFLFTMSITQVWRVISEIFRADYRGGGRLSAYQIMAVVSVLYSYGIAYLSSGPHSEIADVITGLWILWNPAMMCFSLALWIAMFMYTGRSTVTGSTMSFYVHKDRI